MKSSAVLASLLFGSFAAAAPVDRRELAYKTEIVYETVVVFTTVYEDDIIPEATTTPAGYFYEQPKTPSSVAAKPTQAPAAAPAPAPAAPVEEKKPSSAPAVSPVYVAPSPAPVVEQPKPVVEAPQAPAPAASSAAPAPAPAPAPAASSAAPVYQAPQSKPATSSSGSDMTYKDVDMTIYDNNGGFGACGTKLYDTDMIVALAKPAWGESTYNSQTGEATNPWCGQKIKVAYNGNEIEATIMDLCPGCAGNDIDLSLAAWTKLTGMAEKTRLKASWSKIS